MAEYTNLQKKDMKERLWGIISKKLETTMIFPLSQFESDFGHLWGHGLREDELTPDQKINKKKWEHCRGMVLDNGNRQKRGLSQELESHDVIWNRYRTILKFSNKERIL